MDRELLFAKALETVRRTAKEQGNSISAEQLKDAFSELALEEGQLALVKDYLKKRHIGIGQPPDPESLLTGEEAGYLEQYMEGLQLLKKVSDGEKEAIILSAMAGDRTAQERLMKFYLPDVAEIAKLYTGQGVFLEDLIGEGNLAVAAGVTMLGCLEHAAEAEGMLGKMIMDAMENLISENMEQQQKDRKVLSRVNEVADRARELGEELQRKVTVKELSAETGLSEEEILEAVRMSGDNIEYMEKAALHDG